MGDWLFYNGAFDDVQVFFDIVDFYLNLADAGFQYRGAVL